MAQIQKAKFINVDQDAIVYLYTPPNYWGNPDMCGDFPCTGPLNVMLSFKGATFSGDIRPFYTAANF
jgi:hypothetical protein